MEASTALVFGALSKGWISNIEDSGIGNLKVVGLAANLPVAFVAAEAAVTLVNTMGSLLAVGNILGRAVHALASMPLVAAPVVAVARGSVNRVLHNGNIGGGGRGCFDCNRSFIFGNETPVAVEVRAATVDAVGSLLA